MADFAVVTHHVKIEEHPNADRLEIARIGDYRCIVVKGEFQNGDICAYIPEASVVPETLIHAMGLEGRLAGPKKDRVKAVKLRGTLSQGLVYPMPGYPAGADVTAELGIVKYEPDIPGHMRGELESRFGATLKFPVEDIKKHPDMFQDGETVVITEKIHGTWCCLARVGGEPLVTSLGLSEKGLALKLNEANRNNIYVRQWRASQSLLERMAARLGNSDFYVLGELYGGRIQDLKYGLSHPEFRTFDIMTDGHYQPWETVADSGWSTVPMLYQGPWSKEILAELTNGPSIAANGAHFREGIVIRAVPEAVSNLTGTRKIAKSISEQYLLRQGGTELR